MPAVTHPDGDCPADPGSGARREPWASFQETDGDSTFGPVTTISVAGQARAPGPTPMLAPRPTRSRHRHRRPRRLQPLRTAAVVAGVASLLVVGGAALVADAIPDRRASTTSGDGRPRPPEGSTTPSSTTDAPAEEPAAPATTAHTAPPEAAPPAPIAAALPAPAPPPGPAAPAPAAQPAPAVAGPTTTGAEVIDSEDGWVSAQELDDMRASLAAGADASLAAVDREGAQRLADAMCAIARASASWSELDAELRRLWPTWPDPVVAGPESFYLLAAAAASTTCRSAMFSLN